MGNQLASMCKVICTGENCTEVFSAPRLIMEHDFQLSLRNNFYPFHTLQMSSHDCNLTFMAKKYLKLTLRIINWVRLIRSGKLGWLIR